LPDPVGDFASTSMPASASGRTRAWIGNGSWIERAESASTIGVDTPSSRKVCCVKLFDSFTGSRLAYLETPEGGTRSSSHREDRIVDPLPQGSSGIGIVVARESEKPQKGH
jgi:hypothetical protein